MDSIKHKIAYGSQKELYSNFNQQQFYILEALCKNSKELYNAALHNIKSYHRTNKLFLNFEQNLELCSTNRFFKSMHLDQAKHVVFRVNKDFCSFLSSSRKEKQRNSGIVVRPPQYKDKEDYFEIVVYNPKVVGSDFILPLSESSKKRFGLQNLKLPVPLNLVNQRKEISEIRIKPKKKAQVFEFEYVYTLGESLIYGVDKPQTINVLFGFRDLYAIGIDNKYTFAIDGKFLFKTHELYRQELEKVDSTNQHMKIANKCNDIIYDYIAKTCNFVLHYALEHGINHINLVAGPSLSTNFHASVYAQLGFKFEALCAKRDIRYTENEDIGFNVEDINFDSMKVIDPNNYKNRAFVHMTDIIDK